ncbi:virion structural protein [Xanthomonas phage XaC1]|nr:virion structural protein [Xanthomonas phage XaC1]
MKNGTWYSISTKKPVLSSNVNMLNRAAEKSIENFNATSDVKIGDKVTSNAGTEYTFNGTGFTNPNGKLLTGGAAQSAMNKLKQQAAAKEPEAKSEEPEVVPGESAVDTSTEPSSTTQPEEQNTDTAGPSAQSIVNQGGNTSQGEPSTEPSNTSPVNEPNPSSPSEGTGPLKNLAKQIKGNKYAKQIVQLLSRGGNVNLIAADVLLKGNISEVIGELNALNNSNTQ